MRTPPQGENAPMTTVSLRHVQEAYRQVSGVPSQFVRLIEDGPRISSLEWSRVFEKQDAKIHL